MTERDAIDASATPATVSSLVADLRALGVEPGMTLMVHSSLSQLGYVSGGPVAVVTALLTSIGDTGTLVMPTHSTDLTDPASWSNPPVPQSWWEPIRAEMPAYDPAMTPTRSMGSIVECFRDVPGVVRSAHPTVSAAAVGPNSLFVTGDHGLAWALGESSPQGRLYELDGHILLLGVSHVNNTSLHLAERHAAPEGAAQQTISSPVMVDGERRWVTFNDLDDDADDFATIGELFGKSGAEQSGPVGAGEGRLMRSRDLVDFAAEWMREHRTWRTGR